LIVTDLAARGIDIPLLNNVVHFDFPPKMKLFIHRSGRTARAGQSGKSYCIITKDEIPYLLDLNLFVGRRIEMQSDESLEDPEVMTYGVVP